MGDQRLRELERRWQASGSHPDAVAFLRERLRAGDLSRDRAQIAAYAGDPAACEASGEAAGPTSLDDWVVGLGRWGPWALLRAVIGAIRPLVPEGSDPTVERHLAALAAAEAWLACPCDEHGRGAWEAANLSFRESGSFSSQGTDDERVHRALLELVRGATHEALGIPGAWNASDQATRALRKAAIAAVGPFRSIEVAARQLYGDAIRDDATVLEHARDALVVWALDRASPRAPGAEAPPSRSSVAPDAPRP